MELKRVLVGTAYMQIPDLWQCIGEYAEFSVKQVLRRMNSRIVVGI